MPDSAQSKLQSGFIEWLGEENLCENVDTALVRARELLAQGPAGKP